MTEQVERFLDRYFETLNGTQSAIYAGFSEKTAAVQASQMLTIQENIDYLQVLRDAFKEKNGINQDSVLNEYRKIAFSDIRKILTVDGGLKDIFEIDDETAAAISGIESFEEFNREGEKLGTNRKIRLHDKLRALEALSKHLGLFDKDNRQKAPVEQKTVKVEIVQPKSDD